MNRAQAVRWIRIGVALALVGFLGWKAGATELRLSSLSWGWVALAAALSPVSLGIRAYNHALLLNRPSRVLTFRQAFTLTVVGVGINLFIPTGAADLAKASWGARTHGNAEAMVVSSVLDKLTSLTALALMGLIAAVLVRMPVLAVAAGLLGIASVVPLALPKAVPWRLLLRVLAPRTEIDPELVAHSARPPLALLGWVYAVSLAGWLLTYAVMWACCLAVGALVTPTQVLAFAPLTSVARLVPVSVAGIGVGEATFAALLIRAGVDPALASRAVLLSMLLLVLAPGAVGALIVARGRRNR